MNKLLNVVYYSLWVIVAACILGMCLFAITFEQRNPINPAAFQQQQQQQHK